MDESRDDETHRAYWKKMAGLWQQTPSPVRPSFGDREIYRELLERRSTSENILILGSTPELRDLAAQKGGARIHVADFSRAMLAAMRQFTEFADPAKEVLVEENWLKLSLPKNSFDVILGDLVLQQVPTSLESELLGKISSLLSDSGVFVGRFQFLDTDAVVMEPDDIILRALRDPLPDDQKVVPLRLRLLWRCADLSKRVFDRTRAALLIDEFMKKRNIKSALLERTKKNILENDEMFRNWSPPSEATLTSLLLSHFRIIEKKHADDYKDARLYPFFVLGKRREMTPRLRFNFHFAIWSRVRFLPRVFVQSWQLSELKKTLRLAYRNVPFYRTLWDKENVHPRDIRALRDLSRLPIVDKRLLRMHSMESVMHGTFPLRFVEWSETSGSTGEPFRIPRTSPARFFQDGRYNVFYWYGTLLRRARSGRKHRAFSTSVGRRGQGFLSLLRRGITVSDIKKLRVAHIRTVPEKNHSAQYFFRSIGDACRNPKEVILALRDFKPDILKAPPTVMIELARRREELQLGKLPTPEYIISYGEAFTATERKIIKDAFGSDPYDHYGLEEVGVIGFDCEEHNGVHVNEESHIVELLDENGKAVAGGVLGRIVVTYFYNYVMPFIRYDTGDKGVLLNDPCPCGLNSPRLKVDGWRGSFLTISEKKIHSAEFAAILRQFSAEIFRYQIAKTGADRLAIRIIPTKNFTEDVSKKIKEEFYRRFSFEPEIAMVDTLPLSARGKAVVFVDESPYN